MNRADLTEKLLDIKREKGWTWKYICGADRRHVADPGHGRHSRPAQADQAAGRRRRQIVRPLEIEQTLINEVPMRGTATPMPPTDPLIYRFYELILVNGPAVKVLIEEEFGDGIMSAIDFDMDITRKSDPKGDRVQIGMTGKFLPFKYYGAKGNELAYGLKEE